MPRKYVRHPKRVTRRGDDFTELDFVRASGNVGTFQAVVSRVGASIIGGNFTGNARGANAIDTQVLRGDPADASLVASGENAVLFGTSGKASGLNSVAVGNAPSASGEASVAVGASTIATGDDSVALGTEAQALATAAVAVGLQVVAGAANAMAFGVAADAEGARSLALGYGAETSADDEVVIAGATIYLQVSGVKKKIWNEVNDGSGSGLDADLLDGHDTSYFATAGHTHAGGAYVDESGDTMTGALNIIVSATANPLLKVKGSASADQTLLTLQNSSSTDIFQVYNYYGYGALVGINFTSSYDGSALQIKPVASSTRGITVKGLASQSGHLLAFQNSSGTVLSYVGADGSRTLRTRRFRLSILFMTAQAGLQLRAVFCMSKSRAAATKALL